MSLLPIGDYQPQATTSQKMMKIFAFASSLLELLAVGLQTYNRARYRQFVKRIGYMIRFVSFINLIKPFSYYKMFILL